MVLDTLLGVLNGARSRFILESLNPGNHFEKLESREARSPSIGGIPS